MRELKNSLILMVKVNILYLSLFLFSSFVISQADDFTEELVVTGTLIKAKEVRIINPYFEVSKEDIEKSGAFRLEDYLSSLPQINPGNSALQSGFSNGIASVSLRGLGGDRTLVLIDGKRLSPGTPFDGHAEADINQIPDALVKRITQRTREMINKGAIEEVKNFMKLKVSKKRTANKAIGLQEIKDHIHKKMDIDDVIEKISVKTRQYAKRQTTWSRGNMLDWNTLKSNRLKRFLKKI